MSKILILGDIHGRQFWKDACLNHKDEFEKIVFLGDYVAPYKYEEITNKTAIEIFKEIVEFKRENPDKVILLFGNHDATYLNPKLCECRMDIVNWKMLNEFYLENIKLFDLAWEMKIGEKRYFFSHAGVRKGWFDNWVKDKLFKWDNDELPDAGLFNDVFHVAYDNNNQKLVKKLEAALGVYSRYRGWLGPKDGSIIWADINEYVENKAFTNDYENVTFICGHSQLEDEPIITEYVADLDCRRPFVLDTETGEIKEYK